MPSNLSAILLALKIFALVLSLCGKVCGDYPHDAVCDVAAWPSDGPCSSGTGGSGCLVGVANGHGLVISAAHVFEDGNTHRITCAFRLVGKTCKARLLAVDPRLDAAALDIVAPPDIPTPPVKVATKEDGPYTCVGYPYNAHDQMRYTTGAFLGYAGSGSSAWSGVMFHTRTKVISGYSGGARFNRYGDYCGIVSGMTGDGPNSMDRTYGCGGPALLKFIGKYMPVEDN